MELFSIRYFVISSGAIQYTFIIGVISAYKVGRGISRHSRIFHERAQRVRANISRMEAYSEAHFICT